MLTPTQLDTLREILSYRRPYGSATERQFVARYVLTLPNAEMDIHGNVHVEVGKGGRVLWSCHTDTVHRTGGRQRIAYSDGWFYRGKSATDCLGADNGAGVFILREMILAGVSGYYLFHNGEERGGIGSSALAETHADLLACFDYAIAFDRRGTADIITHQFGDRTASDSFAVSLAEQLSAGGLPGYAPAHGVYTDTAEYAGAIPECSNVSVGYYHEHSERECLDAYHVGSLLDALLCLDVGSLVCERRPGGRWADEDKWDEDEDEAVSLGEYRAYSEDTCSLCDEPHHMCQCSEDDRAFWRYLRSR